VRAVEAAGIVRAEVAAAPMGAPAATLAAVPGEPGQLLALGCQEQGMLILLSIMNG